MSAQAPALYVLEGFEAHACIRSFRRIVGLTIYVHGNGDTSLARLHGLSPVLKSLTLHCSFIPVSEAFDLICSFPLLEDLSLQFLTSADSADAWSIPRTSPKFTGTLSLKGGLKSIARWLLGLPQAGGLHFTRISMRWYEIEDLEWARDLGLACSSTLESLAIDFVSFSICGVSSLPPPLDLSKAAKLKDVDFMRNIPDIQWIVMAFETAIPKGLQLTIFPSIPIEDADHRQWQNLDRLLARSWTSHSPCIRIGGMGAEARYDFGALVQSLLPELASKRAVEVFLTWPL